MTSGRPATEPATDMSVHGTGQRTARLAYVGLAWIFLACLFVQLFLVGLDLFEVTGEGSSVHRDFAYLYGWLTPVMVLVGVAARLPTRLLALTVLLLVLFAVQTYLPTLAEEQPWLAATHAVNALAVVWLTFHLGVASRHLVEPHLLDGGP